MPQDNSLNMNLPMFPEPFWRDSIDFPSFSSLKEDMKVDVAIIGAGITGITTAYLLGKAGYKVALLEAGKILNGTTGHTTAKITAQHGLIYDELIHHFGEEKTQLYYQANMNARDFIKNVISELQIDCDFSEEDAYIYTNSESYMEKIHNELEAYKRLRISSDYVETIPFNIPIMGAIVMKNQAQFHPLKYLTKLVEEFIKLGGQIFEQTTAIDVAEGSNPAVITRDNHKIICDYVVSCSHFPFYDLKSFFFTRMYAERSYIISLKTEQKYPGGMYLSAEEPKRSIRSTSSKGEQFILIGGENHKTGHGIDTLTHYEALANFSRDVFGTHDIRYRWSAQDLTTLDNIPYIGPITSANQNILVATGYRKWGMTNGTAAAMLIQDLILKKDTPFLDVYTPSRFNADPSIKNFITQNADVAGQLLKGKLEFIPKDPSDVANGQGAVVIVNGQRAGAYRDSDGQLHLVDTTCTHIGCELSWNHGDHTWDCPCHGSRFSIDGEVVEGPAKKPLKKLTIE